MSEKSSATMTPRQARLAVRSLAYRRRLMKGVPTLEANIKAYLKSSDGMISSKDENQNTVVIGGFLVKLKEDELILEEVDPIEFDQLEFEFMKPGDQL